MIKRSVMVMITIMMVIFAAGCLDYKTYDQPEADETDVELVNEIAQLERELGIDGTERGANASGEDSSDGSEVIEEVVLPELGEEEMLSEEPSVITVKENEAVKLNVKIVDPDQDTVTYTFSKPLSKEGEWKTNYGDAGEYLVTVTATDGKLTTEKKVRIMVERVNVPPVITALADLMVKEGEVVELQPKVNDPNNDPLTITVSEPLKSGSFSTDHTSAGEYQIKISATDGELFSEETFKLTVEDVNELPVITELTDVTVKEGETITLKPAVSDLDEDEIALTISDPVGDDGVWETSFTDHGEYFVTVTANDGKDAVHKRIRVLVEDVNMPPEIVEVKLVAS